MSQCAIAPLQRQHRRETLDVGGKALDRLRRLEAKMIVAMRDLSRAAGIDDVELRSDLIGRPEPGLAHQRDDCVAIIGREDRGVAQAELLERVPDAVVGARLGEMVAAADIARALFLDDRPVMRIGLVDRGMVGERVADDDDAGAVGQRLDPFRHQFLAGLRAKRRRCAPRGHRRRARSTRRRGRRDSRRG